MEKDSLYFEKLGENFQKFICSYDSQRRQQLIFEKLLASVKIAGKRVLEVGCGTGIFSKEITNRGGRLIVLDIGESLVRKVSEETLTPGITADACHLPFGYASFDMVISSECIEHTSNPTKAFKEFLRVLKPDGIVCVTTPNLLWYPILWLSQKLLLRKFSGPENWLFPQRILRALRKQKFTKIRSGGCHLFPFQWEHLQPILQWLDNFDRVLFPLMINFGVSGVKKNERYWSSLV